MSDEDECQHFIQASLPMPDGPVSHCALCPKTWGKWELGEDGKLYSEILADTRGWRCVIGTNAPGESKP